MTTKVSKASSSLSERAGALQRDEFDYATSELDDSPGPGLIERHEAVVIGAGQAGLATSWHLRRREIEHVVLERGRVAETWRSRRWDSFRLLIPNAMCRLPGFSYCGPDPDGFMHRDEIVEFFEQYVASFQPPVREGVSVTAMRQNGEQGWRLITTAGVLTARSVLVATGAYQVPYVPELTTMVSAHIAQLHADAYRNPNRLLPGAVLVVGSGSSGAQIAAELARDGRQVYLATGRSVWLRRRYRGRDIADWADAIGFFEQPVESLRHPSMRREPMPILEGNDTGADLTLPLLEERGVILTGRLVSVIGCRVEFADGLAETLAAAEDLLAKVLGRIDDYIAAEGIRAPADRQMPPARPSHASPTTLDLDEADVRTIIWATGYHFDFSWIHDVPVDAQGYPPHSRGVSPLRGLYFIGLPWLTTRGSAAIPYVGADAGRLSEHLVSFLMSSAAGVCTDGPVDVCDIATSR